jgi:tetratricopeptide (TPR) repeat protein
LKRIVAGAIALSVLALGGWSAGRRASVRARAEAGAESAREAAVRDADIAFFTLRAGRDPYGAGDRARLGSLLLARARASGRYEDLAAAEQSARASLELRRGRNRGGALVLTNALMGQHRFREALAEAGRLEEEDSTDITITSLTGEILLELGRYDEAARRFARIGTTATNLAAQMRVARWREINGDVEGAYRLLVDARTRAQGAFGLSREQRAWFELRVAEFALRYGREREGNEALARGFGVSPGDYRLHAAAARHDLAHRRWNDAADHAAQSLESHFDPATLALLAQAERGRGDSTAANRAVDAMVLAIRGQPGAWHRAWSLALLDEGRALPEVLAQSRRDLEERQDVYAWDLLAWALHCTGDDTGARDAIGHALATGIRDPQVLAHAAAIRGGTT